MPRIRYLGAKKLASAVLLQALDDWCDPVRHEEVEVFLDGRLIDLYLDIAGIDKGEYLKIVRGNTQERQDDFHGPDGTQTGRTRSERSVMTERIEGERRRSWWKGAGKGL